MELGQDLYESVARKNIDVALGQLWERTLTDSPKFHETIQKRFEEEANYRKSFAFSLSLSFSFSLSLSLPFSLCPVKLGMLLK